ncbi:MAG TPA: hypothetical protein VM492_09480 [Sumerlaeia bacterium]|nr:hypothetical protein [Sumerlaeia bacterium]
MQINSRTYLNVILTVIAVLLLVWVAQSPPRLDTGGSAYAQETRNTEQDRQLRQTISTPELTAAVMAVAKANESIAKELNGVAKAINNVAKATSSGR